MPLLAKVNVVAVDKTGTLTFGRPEVVRIERFTADFEEDEMLRLGASLERRSSHPLAKAIIDRSTQRGLSIAEPEDFEVVAGRGVRGTVSGRRILARGHSEVSRNANNVVRRAEPELTAKSKLLAILAYPIRNTLRT